MVVVDEAAFVSDDLVLISVPSASFKNIIKHFPIEKGEYMNAVGEVDGTRVVVRTMQTELKVEDRNGDLIYTNPITYNWPNHSSGKCGLAVVAKRDSGSCIVGIHSAGAHGHLDSYGIVVTRPDLERVIKSDGFRLLSAVSESRMINKGLYGEGPHPKSLVNYEYVGDSLYFGQIAPALVKNKSRMKRTPFCEDNELEMVFYETIGFVRETVYLPPLMQPKGKGSKYVSPWNNFIRDFGCKKPALDMKIIEKCIDKYVNHVVEGIKEKGFKQILQPYDAQTVLNGVSHDALVRRMDTSKAAGFGTPGPKKDYVVRHLIDSEVRDDFKDPILEEVLEIMDCYERGERAGIVFTGTLKDEPRPREKVMKGKTRVFAASTFASLTLSKMFLGPLYTLMIEYGFLFGTSIGIDMHRDADVLYRRRGGGR